MWNDKKKKKKKKKNLLANTGLRRDEMTMRISRPLHRASRGRRRDPCKYYNEYFGFLFRNAYVSKKIYNIITTIV
jgi:hypothetical protein